MKLKVEVKKVKYVHQHVWSKGFTLIELLMVMAIIAVLAGFVVVNFPSAQKRARDAQRKNDLLQYQRLLETYANQTDGFYPMSSGSVLSPVLCGYLSSKLGAIACEDDSMSGETKCDGNVCGYAYQSNQPAGCSANEACATQFVLWAPLENGLSTGSYWVVCSDGVSGEKTTVSPTGGNCPI